MKHRGHGEGSIVLRKDGRWQAAIRTHTIRKYVYASTRDEVSKRLRAILNAQDAGERIHTPSRKIMRVYLQEWLTYQKSRVRPNTLRFYTNTIDLHITPVIGSLRLTALNPQDVERVLIRARDMVIKVDGNGVETKLSPRTIGYIRQMLFMALKKAVQWELIRRNVAESISAPKRVRPDIHPFDDDELKAFLGAIKGHEYEAFFLVAVTLGLRKGELIGLKWSDVRLDECPTICVRRTLQRGLELPPKTESSKRDIRIPASILPTIKSWRTRQLEWRMKAGPKWERSNPDWVFSTESGMPMDQSHVSRLLNAICGKVGIAHHRFHDLRHTCATHLLRHGARLEDVSKLLGHGSKVTTMEIYLHCLPDAAASVASIMDGILAI